MNSESDSPEFPKRVQQAITDFQLWCEDHDPPDVEFYLAESDYPDDVMQELRGHMQAEQQLQDPVANDEDLDGRADEDARGRSQLETRSVDSDELARLQEERRIGRYKLLQQIGQGGMGTVWMAEQASPVRRRVALKIIRDDKSSKDIIARFDAERQALAMMDHQNIARVFDAGTTDGGAPYFVMELVKGIPLTRYCDENRLSIEQRLELFIPVCSAVQHAHQKGIIHRDIKPSNVLVTLYDGVPVPKVIDFGLAKALDAANRLTDKTLFTEFGNVIGTLQYMAPEQAEVNALDVDTRADIYSLGVMLYELLTGSTPLDVATIGKKELLKLLVTIRESDPPRPSQRLSSTEEEAVTTISQQRRISQALLQQILQGELDWIAMRALEKNRTRRYETASGLADDIRHYLNGEVVEARPPSTTYRLKKFIRRHRAGVIAASLIVLTLLGGIVATTSTMRRAQRAEALAEKRAASESKARQEVQDALDLARVETYAKEVALQKKDEALASETRQKQYAEAVADFVENDFLALTSVEGQSQLFADESSTELTKDTTLRELLDRAAEKLNERSDLDPVIEARLLSIIGNSYRANGDAAIGLPFLQRALEIRTKNLPARHSDVLSSMNNLAEGYRADGQLNKALPLYEQTLELRKAELGDDHPESLASMNNLAVAYDAAGQLTKALSLFEQTLRLTKAKQGIDHPATLGSMNNLAAGYRAAGQLDKALPLYEQTLELRKAKLGVDHPQTLTSMDNLANGYQAIGQLTKALPLLEQTLKLRIAKLGNEHPDTLKSINNLALGYYATGQLTKALPLMERTLALRKMKLGNEHPGTLTSMDNLASIYRATGQLRKALPLYEQTLELTKVKLGDNHPKTLVSMNNLASAYRASGQLAKALPLSELALERRKAKLGNDHPDTMASMDNLASVYRDSGRLDEALRLCEQTLERRKAKLGDDHPDTLNSMNNLAGGYIDAGQPDKAMPLLEQTVQLAKSKLGVDHPGTLSSMNNLASCYQDAGQPEKALPLIEQTLKLVKAKLGDDHPVTLTVMNNLGRGYKTAGQLDKALPLFERTLELTITAVGDEHPDTQISMNNLAAGYLAAGQLDKALPLYERTLQLRKAKLGDDHPDTLASMASLAAACRSLGKLDQAIALFEEVVEKNSQPPNLRWVSGALRTAYLKAGRVTDLADRVPKDLEQARNKYPADSVELSGILASLGRDLIQIGDFTFAQQLLRESVTIREKKLPDDWRYFNAQSLLGEALLGKAKNLEPPESNQEDETGNQTEPLLREARSLLVNGYTGIKSRQESIPQADRPQLLTEAVDRLINYAQHTGDEEMLKKWQDEKDSLNVPGNKP